MVTERVLNKITKQFEHDFPVPYSAKKLWVYFLFLYEQTVLILKVEPDCARQILVPENLGKVV